jgi:deazaflavin-dependent oxidoreductase (nitroreductase family)
MPIPMWIAQVNKRFFNPMELKRGVRPVMTHVGRSSGETYRTPLDAHRVDGGWIFIVMYGPDSDWVLNILASGSATLNVDGEEFSLISPRIIDKAAAWKRIAEGTTAPPDYLKVNEYLLLEVADSR